MGDIADMHLDGTLCERCGTFLDGESPGYPRYCKDCSREKKAINRTWEKGIKMLEETKQKIPGTNMTKKRKEKYAAFIDKNIEKIREEITKNKRR